MLLLTPPLLVPIIKHPFEQKTDTFSTYLIHLISPLIHLTKTEEYSRTIIKQHLYQQRKALIESTGWARI